MRTRDKKRIRKARRPLLRLAAAFAAVVVACVVVVPHSTGDDRELLKENTADPFLFILLDNSLSMGLTIDGRWVHGNADDPRSRLYQAKEALYTVLGSISGVRFGFGTFNQDQLSIIGKHFLYHVADDTDPASGTSANQTAIRAIGLGYPVIEPNNQVEVPTVDAEGFPDVDIRIDGDMMTFGQAPVDPGGTCGSPLDLRTEREKINRYPKLGIDGAAQTEVFISISGRVYHLRWDLASGALGDKFIKVNLHVHRVTGCTGDVMTSSVHHSREDLTLKLWRDFLMTDDGSGQVVFKGVGKVRNQAADATEDTGGFWSLRDAEGGFSCGEAKPFSGGGWEGNYDTGTPFSDSPGLTGPNQEDLEPNLISTGAEFFDT